MSETLTWWLMAQVVALVALPLGLALFGNLPDRGYGLSKAFGLLLLGYFFWIAVLAGLPNEIGTISIVLLALLVPSAFVAWRSRDTLLAFGRERWWLIASTEALFFLAFITAAYLRSFTPEISGTEKPMDFMFLNAITRAEDFPPPDAWLQGESVSYYYFGYLLISVMSRLAGVSTAIGFNLGLAMIVALATIGAFSLVYNLCAPRALRGAEAGPGTPRSGFSTDVLWRPLVFGVVAALLLTTMGNMEGLLEWLAAHNIGSGGFWDTVNIRDGGRALEPYQSEKWYPDGFIFWWLATRIIETAPGTFGIHEMPFFSFILGDMHPHVMSIPFVLLAVGGALMLLRSDTPLDLVYWLERPIALVALAIMLGALAFLNTWDMPTLAFVVTIAALIRNRLLAEKWSWGIGLDTLGFVLPLFLAAMLAFTPFFFGGFDSQAAGFTAEPGEGTRLFDVLLIWGAFAALVLPYAIWRLSRSGSILTARSAAWLIAPVLAVIGLWLLWDGLAVVFEWLPNRIQPNNAPGNLFDHITERGMQWITALVLGLAVGLLSLALVREIDRTKKDDHEGMSHVFALLLSLTASLLVLGAEFFYIRDNFNTRMNTVFKLYYQAWLLLSVAGGFALFEMTRSWRLRLRLPRRMSLSWSSGNWTAGEFLAGGMGFAGAAIGVWILRDTTGSLIFAGALIGGGLLFALGAANVLLWRSGGQDPYQGALTWRAAWAGLAGAFLVAAFTYPLTATWSQTAGCVSQPLFGILAEDNCGDEGSAYTRRSLDGLSRGNQDEVAAIKWLLDLDGQPNIVEAVGGSYSEAGRISASTGFPTVIQWPPHQGQWRGGDVPYGREDEVRQLYTSTDEEAVRELLARYRIRYVVLGNVERQTYPESRLAEMTDLFEPIFTQGDMTVLRVRPDAVAGVTVE